MVGIESFGVDISFAIVVIVLTLFLALRPDSLAVLRAQARPNLIYANHMTSSSRSRVLRHFTNRDPR